MFRSVVVDDRRIADDSDDGVYLIYRNVSVGYVEGHRGKVGIDVGELIGRKSHIRRSCVGAADLRVPAEREAYVHVIQVGIGRRNISAHGVFRSVVVDDRRIADDRHRRGGGRDRHGRRAGHGRVVLLSYFIIYCIFAGVRILRNVVQRTVAACSAVSDRSACGRRHADPVSISVVNAGIAGNGNLPRH